MEEFITNFIVNFFWGKILFSWQYGWNSDYNQVGSWDRLGFGAHPVRCREHYFRSDSPVDWRLGWILECQWKCHSARVKICQDTYKAAHLACHLWKQKAPFSTTETRLNTQLEGNPEWKIARLMQNMVYKWTCQFKERTTRGGEMRSRGKVRCLSSIISPFG